MPMARGTAEAGDSDQSISWQRVLAGRRSVNQSQIISEPESLRVMRLFIAQIRTGRVRYACCQSIGLRCAAWYFSSHLGKCGNIMLTASYTASSGPRTEDHGEVAIRRGLSSCTKFPLMLSTRQLDLRVVMVGLTMGFLLLTLLRRMLASPLLKSFQSWIDQKYRRR